MVNQSLTQLHVADERYIFSNETLRYQAKKVARGPAIRSFAAREMSVDNNITDSQEEARQWNCLAAFDTKQRFSLGLGTFRYFWGGMPGDHIPMKLHLHTVGNVC